MPTRDWTCRTCRAVNAEGTTRCEACNTPRGSTTPGLPRPDAQTPPGAAGSVTCQTCGGDVPLPAERCPACENLLPPKIRTEPPRHAWTAEEAVEAHARRAAVKAIYGRKAWFELAPRTAATAAPPAGYVPNQLRLDCAVAQALERWRSGHAEPVPGMSRAEASTPPDPRDLADFLRNVGGHKANDHDPPPLNRV